MSLNIGISCTSKIVSIVVTAWAGFMGEPRNSLIPSPIQTVRGAFASNIHACFRLS